MRQDAFIVTSPQNVQPVQSQPLPASCQNIPFQPTSGTAPRPVGPSGISGQQFSQSGPQSVPSFVSMHSPAQISSPGTMLTAPSPQSQVAPSPASRGNAGVPSPGAPLNTPGNPGSVGPAPSPGQPRNSDEQEYLDKLNKLSKYIDPLRRMVNKLEKDGDRKKDYIKMKSLLDILTDSSRRVQVQMLTRCEQVLKNFDIMYKVPSGPSTSSWGQHLTDAMLPHIKSSMINHVLFRTFGPAVNTLCGSPIRCPSPPKKKQKTESHQPKDGLPDLLQGEITRLHSRFHVSVDPLHHANSVAIHLICTLDDTNLPSVPPISVTIPGNYPQTSPQCDTISEGYDVSNFSQLVRKNLESYLLKMPNKFSLTSLLNTWEMCVRRSCAPISVAAGS